MPNNNKPIINIEHLSHIFNDEWGDGTKTISDISFNVNDGEFLSLVGPSGSGKSTLLRIIAGLIKKYDGKIERNYQRQAMVFQGHAIFPWLSVIDNVAFGLFMNGMSKDERYKIAQEKINEVGLGGNENKFPGELSGGMRQRVSVARALAVSPQLLLMDEPFSSLDSITADKLKKDIMVIWQKYKMTIIMVNHLIADAVELSDRIIVVSKKPAKIKLTVNIPLPRPRDTRGKEFFDLVDRVTGEIEE